MKKSKINEDIPRTPSVWLTTTRVSGQNPPCLENHVRDVQENNYISEIEEKYKHGNDKITCLHICTYNVRTLMSENKRVELDEALKEIKWDIIGLAETRLYGEKIIEKENGDLFCYIGKTKGLYGVGLLINKRLKKYIKEINLHNERILSCELQINNTNVVVIQVYAPTETSSEDQINILYEELNRIVNTAKSKIIYIIGDFNAKIGNRREGEENILGQYGYGNRNRRGEKLITWLWQNSLTVGNSIFKKKTKNKWTWSSPNQKVKNEIDFVITNKRKTLQDVSVITRFNFESDHRLIRAKIKINHKTKEIHRNEGKKDIPKVISNEDRKKYVEKLKTLCDVNKIKSLNSIQTQYDELENGILKAANESIMKHITKKLDKISNTSKALIEERENLRKKSSKTEHEKQKLKELRKTIKNRIKKD